MTGDPIDPAMNQQLLMDNVTEQTPQPVTPMVIGAEQLQFNEPPPPGTTVRVSYEHMGVDLAAAHTHAVSTEYELIDTAMARNYQVGQPGLEYPGIMPAMSGVMIHEASFSVDMETGTEPGFLAEGFMRVRPDELSDLKQRWVRPGNKYGQSIFIGGWTNSSFSPDRKQSISNGFQGVTTTVEADEITTIKTPIDIHMDEDKQGSVAKKMITILPGGRVVFHDASRIDEAAMGFWSAISKVHPKALLDRITEMEEAIAESVQSCCGDEETKCDRCAVLLSTIPKIEPQFEWPGSPMIEQINDDYYVEHPIRLTRRA